MEEHRVQKFIAQSGFASRRKAEELIEKKAVKVNGEIIKLGDKCKQTDIITINNKKINLNENKKIYIALNKPINYICSNKDEFGRKNIFNLIKKEDSISSLFSVGRLDKDTTGLILITNDGDFSQQIIHPSKNILKTYNLLLDKKLINKDKEIIQSGLKIDNYQLSKCYIKELDKEKFNYTIQIYEGKKRQIRKIFEKQNYSVLKLHREKIGNLSLKELNIKQGEYKKYSKQELIKKIFN